jgi:DNA-directed RNA polymerase specialized sigma24 family protein
VIPPPATPRTDPSVDPAFDAVFTDSYPAVVRAAQLVVGDREVAKELAQDAFVQLLRHWKRVSGHDNPGAWVRRVAIRMAVRARERAERSGAVASTGLVSAPDGGRIDLDRALAQLPAMQRGAVVLHYLEDLPTDEVARVLGCRPATARVHLHRARARLAELLAVREPAEEVDRAIP